MNRDDFDAACKLLFMACSGINHHALTTKDARDLREGLELLHKVQREVNAEAGAHGREGGGNIFRNTTKPAGWPVVAGNVFDPPESVERVPDAVVDLMDQHPTWSGVYGFGTGIHEEAEREDHPTHVAMGVVLDSRGRRWRVYKSCTDPGSRWYYPDGWTPSKPEAADDLQAALARPAQEYIDEPGGGCRAKSPVGAVFHPDIPTPSRIPGYSCTRGKGHAGHHVAIGVDEVICAWPNCVRSAGGL